jgi:hypothetical protein
MAFTYQPNLLAPYLTLSQGSSIQAECVYCSPLSLSFLLDPLVDVWIDGDNELRSKTRVRNFIFTATILPFY